MPSSFFSIKGLMVFGLGFLFILSAADYTTQGWSYKQNITLNTSSTGANISGDVNYFPVLIRLTSANFNFSQTSANGADLRFTNSALDTLPYEIERWDASNQQAEVWVNVNQIRGQNSTQYIVMYWGNSSATSQSNSGAVFNAANGFAGVWHLSNTPSTTASRIVESSSNRNHGTCSGGLGDANITTSLIGKGLVLHGTTEQITVPHNASIDFDETRSFILSVWVKVDVSGPQPPYERRLFTKRAGSNWYSYMILENQFPHLELTASASVGWNSTLINDDVWHHSLFEVNRTAGTMTHFFDGVKDASQSNPFSASCANSADLLLCGWEGQFYRGDVDEMRIETTVRNADWYKLTYQNQKAAQTLVQFSGGTSINYDKKLNDLRLNGSTMLNNVTMLVYDFKGRVMLKKQMTNVGLNNLLASVTSFKNGLSGNSACMVKILSNDRSDIDDVKEKVILNNKIVLIN